jgi:hypothetical protein
MPPLVPVCQGAADAPRADAASPAPAVGLPARGTFLRALRSNEADISRLTAAVAQLDAAGVIVVLDAPRLRPAVKFIAAESVAEIRERAASLAAAWRSAGAESVVCCANCVATVLEGAWDTKNSVVVFSREGAGVFAVLPE